MKYQVTDSRGTVHKRDTTSSGRVYTHCIVGHKPAVVPDGRWPKGWPAADEVSWAGNARLAESRAAAFRKHLRPGTEVEVIEVK